jgi:hypothetical protein
MNTPGALAVVSREADAREGVQATFVVAPNTDAAVGARAARHGLGW